MRILEPFEDYYWKFYQAQTASVQAKIDYVLQIIISVEQIPQKFFKHVRDGIYEIRIQSGNNMYRIFSFFDDGKLVILLHGMTKKTQKLPQKEIEKAIKLRKAYYESKSSQND